MKKEIRLLGIDDAPFDKFKDKKTLIVGVFFRGGSSIDGVLSEIVAVDGADSTTKIIKMVKKSKFYPQLKAILLKGLAFGGFNMIDIEKVSSKTKVPVIVVMRKIPDKKKMGKALIKLGKKSGVTFMERAGKIHKTDNIYIQFSGTTLAKAKEIIRISSTRGHIPEPIRIAHLMAGGITLGQSRGKA